jgi:monoamine oxidase
MPGVHADGNGARHRVLSVSQAMAPMSEPVDVIVVGAGVSGLAAARDLSRNGLRVLILEARQRMGGRIDTQRPAGWANPVEMGAEFIHGGNPYLWRLMRSARAKVRRTPERHWFAQGGAFRRIAGLDRTLASVTGHIDPAKAGSLSFAGYFARFPAAFGPDAWALARGFVEGFEAAPLDGISARSLAGESRDEGQQFVVPGGYDQIVGRLAADCETRGVRILRESVVRSVSWRKGAVRVAVSDLKSGRRSDYSSRAAVVTLPLGVLKAARGTGSVRFRPALAAKRAAIAGMQMGHVVRISLRFSKACWRRMLPQKFRGARSHGFGFIHSNSPGVRVWWSQSDQPVLVGWAGGPTARRLLGLAPEARLRQALASLSAALGMSAAAVRRGVIDWREADWSRDPFSRGAYSYTAAGHDGGAALLRRPVKGTLFFAGEATASGSEVGTVHGALASGVRAAGEAARALGRTRRLLCLDGVVLRGKERRFQDVLHDRDEGGQWPPGRIDQPRGQA